MVNNTIENTATMVMMSQTSRTRCFRLLESILYYSNNV